MKITVYNKKSESHLISKTNGVLLNIQPFDSVSFITSDDNEINYWRRIQPTSLDRYGLDIEFDDGIWEEGVSFLNPDSCVSTNVSKVEKEQPIVTEQTTGYTEESLMQMDKEDLLNICKNFDIPAKRNNSVKTLVRLIMEKV